MDDSADLTDAEKQRIRAEENYRQQIRQELEKLRPKSAIDRLFSVLNAPIVIWLLTSVIIGFITHAYGRTQVSLKEQAARRTRTQELGVELWTRLSQARGIRTKEDLIAFGNALTVYGSNPGTRPEFQQMPIEGIYFEYTSTVPAGLQASPAAFAEAVRQIKRLKEYYFMGEGRTKLLDADDRDLKSALTTMTAVLDAVYERIRSAGNEGM